MQMFNPAHPGEILREYMGTGLTVSALAEHLGMTRANLSMIVNGRSGVSATTALKLSEAFENTSPEFWLNLQNSYDLWHARQAKRIKVAPVRAGHRRSTESA